MSNNHVLTRQVGNLRGFSTDSIYLRPPNVADKAINIQKAPDGTFQLRRGYQAQIGQIGGMGIGTFDNPAKNEVQTVCIGLDGFLYNKLTRQVLFYYNGQITGNITNITQTNPAVVTSNGHGLITGTQVIIKEVDGMANGTSSINNNTYTITVIDPNTFSLNGIDTTSYTPYLSGGIWSIAFADGRYLTLTIYVDPDQIYSNANQSINCDILVNRAAQVNGTQTNVNTITVQFGHEIAINDVVQFTNSVGVLQERSVTAITTTSITVAGSPVTVNSGAYINQYINIPFGKGFDVASPFTIQDFIDVITNPTNGVEGLQVAINGESDLPAAFIQILESTIINSGSEFTLDYWYWDQVNFTGSFPPFPGSADIEYQNSQQFENASMAAFDDVIYIANGKDFPQKYDGQTVYRTGMPQAPRPSAADNTNTGQMISQPFLMNNVYQYGITYEQVDNKGHIVEGELSELFTHTVSAANASINVTVANLQSSPSDSSTNWNTNQAVFRTTATASVYGPDADGFYYDLINVNTGYTLKIGDTAYYADRKAAIINNADSDVFTISVDSGHSVVAGDTIYFISNADVEIRRIVDSVTDTSITISGSEPVSVNPLDTVHSYVLAYKQSKVFGNVAIVSGAQTNVNQITVLQNSPSPADVNTIQVGDVVNFIDSSGNMQRRNVVARSSSQVEIDGIPVNVTDGALIASENQRTNAITLQRLNPNGISPITTTIVASNTSVSNNLRINIYRTKQGESFGVNGKLYLVATIPNDASGPSSQIYIDGIPDTELGRQYSDPDQAPNPPPISKYVRAFGNQMFYAGGEINEAENSDNVFFSEGNDPEIVPLASNFFSVPNVDDDITGIGVAGSTLVVTKDNSLWAIAGNTLLDQFQIIQVAPGTNIGCVSHASIASVGGLMYFLHTNGVYAITESQLFPTDAFGNPTPLSLAIDVIFRETNFLPQNRYVLKRSVALNYTKDNQYLLFLPCEDTQSTIRTANSNSIVLCYDYQHKNWFMWNNINAAGGIFVIDDDLYFQERRTSAVDGNSANLYKQHRFYRLVDHADHAGAQFCEWRSSWEDLGQPEVRKKFCRCILLMDRISEIYQYNNPQVTFSSYLNRLPNLQNTIADITQTDNIRNSPWSNSPWGWNYWSGYQDSFITVNLKQGTVAKSIQVGFKIQGINMDIRLAGFQLEVIPENRMTVVR